MTVTWLQINCLFGNKPTGNTIRGLSRYMLFHSFPYVVGTHQTQHGKAFLMCYHNSIPKTCCHWQIRKLLILLSLKKKKTKTTKKHHIVYWYFLMKKWERGEKKNKKKLPNQTNYIFIRKSRCIQPLKCHENLHQEMSSVYFICWIFLQTFQTYFCIQANTVDPDQTAPRGVVCSGSTLFAKNH